MTTLPVIVYLVLLIGAVVYYAHVGKANHVSAAPTPEGSTRLVSEREGLAGRSSPAGGRFSVTSTASRSETCRSARKGLAWYRGRYSTWLAMRGVRVESGSRAKPHGSCVRVLFVAQKWRSRAHAARRVFERWHERTYEKWRCIHEHEGAWDDPNPPHWGGLQADYSFQQTYGGEFLRRWGTADRWPVWAQLVMAEKAYKTRGFGPWPNTRRMCGL